MRQIRFPDREQSAVPAAARTSVRILPRSTGRVRRGLRVSGLIDDQHRIAVVQAPGRPRRRLLKNLLIIPGCPRKQMLQPVRTAVPERLCQRPAVIVLQLHQQTASHIGGVLAGLPARETARDLSEQFSNYSCRIRKWIPAE